MKVAITGHTSGLGLEIYNFLKNKNYDVIGFSRSNNFLLPNDFENIIEISKKCDLFFNNAHVGIIQSKFIESLYNYLPIITSGSIAADYIKLKKTYNHEKYIIENTHKKYKKISKFPMLLLKMGYLENYNQYDAIPYKEILSFLDTWLENKRASIIEFDNIYYDRNFRKN